MASTDLPKRVFLASCVVIVFGVGVVVGRFQVFPFSVLQYGFNSAGEAWRQLPILLGIRPVAHLRPARYDGEGVTVDRSDDMEPGLTLISGFLDGDNGLMLIAPDGAVVRRWRARFSEIFPNPEHLVVADIVPATDWNTDIHGALALPDGSVVFNFEYGGLVKLDKCGVIDWTVPRITHHSIERAEGGGFWVPGRVFREEFPGLPAAPRGYRVDEVLKVSDDGEVVAELPITDILVENDLLYHVSGRLREELSRWGGEVVHLNDVEEVPSALADQFPMFEAGDLVLSFHALNLIVVVDPEDSSVRWSRAGPWVGQHDPDFVEGGRILVFDNNPREFFLGTDFAGSRILSVDPTARAVGVLFESDREPFMYTSIRGKQQLLANGNLLITESEGGRVIEVADDGTIVWEYVNRYDDDHVATVTQAIRYAPDYFSVDSWACPA